MMIIIIMMKVRLLELNGRACINSFNIAPLLYIGGQVGHDDGNDDDYDEDEDEDEYT